MVSIDPTAILALFVSLVALLISTSQLLQQYFATADGYRRCLPEVMGDWGKKTRKRMRWRELRFETVYFVPRLEVRSVSESGIDWGEGERDEGDEGGRVLAVGEGEGDDRDDVAKGYGEKVCWTALLNQIRVVQRDTKSVYSSSLVWASSPKGGIRELQICATPSVICMRVLRRSWDFMPSEVVRPLCMSTISDIAVIATLLNMSWKEFNPIKGTLIAEGSGQLITSRIIRSLGLCLEYTRTDRAINSDTRQIVRARRSAGDLLLNSYMPIGGLSDLIFGVVVGNQNLGCFDRAMGTIEEIKEFLDFLDETGAENLQLTQALLSAKEDKPGWLPGFNDVIPLTAAKMTSVHSSLRNLPMPNTFSAGLLRTREGLQVFCLRLQRFIAEQKGLASQQLLQVQKWISDLETEYPTFWNANDSTWAYVPMNQMVAPAPAFEASKDYQSVIHDALDGAEAYLVAINEDPSGSMRNDRKDEKGRFCYDTLLVEHLRMAVLAYAKTKPAPGEASKTVVRRPAHWIFPHRGRDWLSASMNVYWDELGGLARKVALFTGCEGALAVDAWVTMVFRAFCWHHCHHMISTKVVLPADWHGSQMPVYIG